MRKSNVFATLCLSVSLLTAGCGDSAKEIKTTKTKPQTGTTGVFSDKPSSGQNDIQLPGTSISPVGAGVHTVKILESLPTKRYVYIRVREGAREFWIATNKKPIQKGAIYHYHGGLLKTNFESKEYNRTFDTLYLVSNLVPANHGQMQGGMPDAMSSPQAGAAPIAVASDAPLVRIADIVKSPEKYKDKVVRVSGKVTKLNANIMGRHWMHLKDGTKDNYDFVITSKQMIPEGAKVSFAGVIHLKKDFGAGYYYDIIMEDAVVVK